MLDITSEAECVIVPVQELFYHEVKEISPHQEILEQVTHEIIGTNKYRNGKKPTPEVEVTIRKVIRDAIEHNDPVPIIIPYGGSKQGDYNVDLAEVMSLCQLQCLEKRVTHFYKPGIEIRFRLEDAIDSVIFNNDWVKNKTEPYIKHMTKLINLMLPSAVIILESTLVDYDNGEYDRLYDILHSTISKNDESQLHTIGWLNGMPLEQLAHYRRGYKCFYPHLNQEKIDQGIAKYFACVMMRKMQGGSGEIVPSIILSFSNPIPGTNQDRRVYYKTNMKQHTHRAPWLGKGHVDLHQGIPYVSGWNGDDLLYEPNTVYLNQLPVEADYVISE